MRHGDSDVFYTEINKGGLETEIESLKADGTA